MELVGLWFDVSRVEGRLLAALDAALFGSKFPENKKMSSTAHGARFPSAAQLLLLCGRIAAQPRPPKANSTHSEAHSEARARPVVDTPCFRVLSWTAAARLHSDSGRVAPRPQGALPHRLMLA